MRRRRYDDQFTPQSPWLDLVNSQQWDGFGNSTDHLLERDWMASFMKYFAHRPETTARSTPTDELGELRGLLRRSAERIASGGSLTRRDLAGLTGFLKAASYLHLVERGGGIRAEPRPVRRNWDWVRSRIALSFVEAVQERPHRVKICANLQCRWAFIDATKSNIRRWCHDRRCGNRDRVRRSRAR